MKKLVFTLLAAALILSGCQEGAEEVQHAGNESLSYKDEMAHGLEFSLELSSEDGDVLKADELRIGDRVMAKAAVKNVEKEDYSFFGACEGTAAIFLSNEKYTYNVSGEGDLSGRGCEEVQEIHTIAAGEKMDAEVLFELDKWTSTDGKEIDLKPGTYVIGLEYAGQTLKHEVMISE